MNELEHHFVLGVKGFLSYPVLVWRSNQGVEMVISRFVKVDDNPEISGALRSHVVEQQKIARVMTISNEKSKAMAKRNRDAIVAAFEENRI